MRSAVGTSQRGGGARRRASRTARQDAEPAQPHICMECGVICNSKTQAMTHLRGRRHIETVTRMARDAAAKGEVLTTQAPQPLGSSSNASDPCNGDPAVVAQPARAVPQIAAGANPHAVPFFPETAISQGVVAVPQQWLSPHPRPAGWAMDGNGLAYVGSATPVANALGRGSGPQVSQGQAPALTVRIAQRALESPASGGELSTQAQSRLCPSDDPMEDEKDQAAEDALPGIASVRCERSVAELSGILQDLGL
eukprot:TRINITY_DN51924_c0_g1_i1.p1 TRINITY_DN51924_c0_g1~~TRINITY_DN51924_c0_g1_i1.p1  ORF type:complete len:253 (+),score=28.55 TRINITY_DN51924_c0_g1_i1:95-853(+)